jgi:hypothetical protein
LISSDKRIGFLHGVKFKPEKKVTSRAVALLKAVLASEYYQSALSAKNAKKKKKKNEKGDLGLLAPLVE